MKQRRIAAGLAIVCVLAALTGAVIARRANDDLVLRTVRIGKVPGSVTIDARTGRAFVVSDPNTNPSTDTHGSISTLDTRTGAVLRTVTVGENPVYPLLDERTQHVFITNLSSNSTIDNTVSMLDARTGALLHVAHLPWFTPPFPPSVLDGGHGHLFLAIGTILNTGTGKVSASFAGSDWALATDARSGHVFTIDRNDGSLGGSSVSMRDAHDRTIWTRAIKDADHLAVDGRTGHVFVTSPTSTTMLDERDGRILHVDPVGIDYWGGEMVGDEAAGRIFVVDFKRTRMTVLDARSGAIVNTIDVPGDWGANRFAIDDGIGRAYVISYENDTLGIINVRNGTLIRTIYMGSGQHPTAVALDERTHRVFVTSEPPTARVFGDDASTANGVLTVLDARTGAVLHKVAVGIAPADVAVDERTGHAFVVNSGGPLRASDPWQWLPAWLRHRLPFIPPPPFPVSVVHGSVSIVDARR